MTYHGDFQTGETIVISKDCKWSNYGDKEPRIMPAGSKLILLAWKPEGFNVSTTETIGERTHHFIFKEDLRYATKV